MSLRICAFAFCLFAGAAFASPCLPPAREPALRLALESGGAEPFAHVSGNELRLQRRSVALQPGTRGEGLKIGYAHDYAIYDFQTPAPSGPASLQPLTNGHLHRLSLPMDVSAALPADWDLRLQPALAVSSNFLKEPDRIGLEALQFNVALMKNFALQAGASWQAGICADHRFGEYRLYPSLAWLWRAGDWRVRLGWPDSEIRRRLGRDFSTALSLSPAGERWRVHHETGGDSWFSHEAWQARWSLEWRPRQSLGLELSAARLSGSRYDFSLAGGEAFRGKTSSPLQLGMSLIWNYRE